MDKQIAEDRQRKRVPFAKDILINGEIMVRAIDISEGGLYVHTGRSNITGRIVEVDIPYRGGNLRVNAMVQHNQEAIGMGLMFVNLEPAKKNKILELIEGLPTEDGVVSETVINKRKKTGVLLIDDNPSTQRIYKSRLVHEGFSVITAEDGFQAIKILKARTADIDIIFLDLCMDKIDGLKVLSILKKTPELKDIPVVMLSSMNSTDIVEKALEKGADKYLAKVNTPPSKLAETVNEILQQAGKKAVKKNCWEFMDCGRDPGGESIAERGICPASVEERLNGVHGGINAGRACWALVGTMCGGKIQGTFAQKYRNCGKCIFYKTVREEEDKDYQDTIHLLNILDQ